MSFHTGNVSWESMKYHGRCFANCMWRMALHVMNGVSESGINIDSPYKVISGRFDGKHCDKLLDFHGFQGYPIVRPIHGWHAFMVPFSWIQARLDTRNQVALQQDHGTENPWKSRLSRNVSPVFCPSLLCEIPILWVDPPFACLPSSRLRVGCGVYHHKM